MRRPALGRGLSGKLLLLATAVVLVGELVIYVPSLARFRLSYLEERIAAAHLATVALDMDTAQSLKPDVEARLLEDAGVAAITLYRPRAQLMLGDPRPIDATVDLREESSMGMIPEAIETLLARGVRTLRVVGMAPPPSRAVVEVVMGEQDLWWEMVQYSARVLKLSIALSLVLAAFLFLSLRFMIVRPLRRVTAEMAAFRQRPEDGTLDRPHGGRGDEIGYVERELAEMRVQIRRALVEKTRLAGLGQAVGRMSHDLRNLLATATLVSDRLETSPDAKVRQSASRLMETLDRATRLCAETLSYAQSRPASPAPRVVPLAELVEELRAIMGERPEPVRWRVAVDPALELWTDPDQLHRVLLNLARNAYEAMGEAGGELAVEASSGGGGEGVVITVADTGGGVPAKVRERLFEPFAGSTKAGGSGLGLAICRELMRGLGGEIRLRESAPGRTIFELRLPSRTVRRGGGRMGRQVTKMRRASLVLLTALMGACSWGGPSLAGYPGLQWKVESFYGDNALEKDASCPQPRMDAVQARVVDETPDKVVMDVRYHWYDDTQSGGGDWPFGGGTGTGITGFCNDWGSRTFTLAKNTAGGLDVVSMTGPQRGRAG